MATQFCWASQQPLGHDVGLQTQAPAAPQAWPLAQGAQAAPAVPQAALPCAAYATHVPSVLQQPFGHDVASQAHLPFVPQRWPDAHATQAPPPVPPVVAVAVAQTPAVVQHPLHESLPHAQTPALHDCDGAQATQAAPEVPQAATVGDVTHWPLSSQQPDGHEAALQPTGTSVGPASGSDPAPPPRPPVAVPPAPATAPALPVVPAIPVPALPVTPALPVPALPVPALPVTPAAPVVPPPAVPGPPTPVAPGDPSPARPTHPAAASASAQTSVRKSKKLSDEERIAASGGTFFIQLSREIRNPQRPRVADARRKKRRRAKKRNHRRRLVVARLQLQPPVPSDRYRTPAYGNSPASP